MHRNFLVLLVVILIVAVMIFAGVHAAHQQRYSAYGNSIPKGDFLPAGDVKGKTAPDFSLNDLDEKPVKLSDFRGKAVLLNFWATWCGPCKIEMPWLVDLQKKYGSQGLQIVGVAMDDTSDKEIADFAHKMGVNYVVLKGTEKVGDLYGGVDRLPLTYFVDRSGKVVDEIVGLRGSADIEEAIKKTLAQGN